MSTTLSQVKLKKVLIVLHFAFGYLTLIGTTPLKAGPVYDFCIAGSPVKNFSSYDNMSSYCKCVQYVLKKNLSPYAQEKLDRSIMNNSGGGQVTEEFVKAGFLMREKCGGYIK